MNVKIVRKLLYSCKSLTKKNDLKLKKKLTRSFVEYKKEEEKEWKGTKENIFQRFVFSFV